MIIMIDSLAIANPSFSLVGYLEIFFSVRSFYLIFQKVILMVNAKAKQISGIN